MPSFSLPAGADQNQTTFISSASGRLDSVSVFFFFVTSPICNNRHFPQEIQAYQIKKTNKQRKNLCGRLLSLQIAFPPRKIFQWGIQCEQQNITYVVTPVRGYYYHPYFIMMTIVMIKENCIDEKLKSFDRTKHQTVVTVCVLGRDHFGGKPFSLPVGKKGNLWRQQADKNRQKWTKTPKCIFFSSISLFLLNKTYICRNVTWL